MMYGLYCTFHLDHDEGNLPFYCPLQGPGSVLFVLCRRKPYLVPEKSWSLAAFDISKTQLPHLLDDESCTSLKQAVKSLGW